MTMTSEQIILATLIKKHSLEQVLDAVSSYAENLYNDTCEDYDYLVWRALSVVVAEITCDGKQINLYPVIDETTCDQLFQVIDQYRGNFELLLGDIEKILESARTKDRENDLMGGVLPHTDHYLDVLDAAISSIQSIDSELEIVY